MGFLGYIVKAIPVLQFAEALRKVFLGEPVFVHTGDGQHGKVDTVRLTPRQAEVLGLVRRGLTSKQIAEVLKVSVGNVDNHVSAAMAALDVASRSHAIAKATDLGLLGTGSSSWESPTVSR